MTEDWGTYDYDSYNHGLISFPGWKTCTIFACDTSSQTSFETTTGLARVEQDALIDIGKTLSFKCPDKKVYDSAKYFEKICDQNGQFKDSGDAADAAKCRVAKKCDNQTIPADKNLILKDAAAEVLEFDEAVYKCNADYATDKGLDSEYRSGH